MSSSGLDIGQALALAYTHWNKGEADPAEQLCQQILAVWPGQTDASHLMGLMAHAYGNLDLAIDHVRQACQSPRAPALYFSNLAEMCRQAGQLAEAEQAGRRAVALDGTMAGAWNNLGIVLQEAGKLDESLACLDHVLALDPGNAEAHNNIANTCKRLGMLDRARVHWARALELRPDYPEPLSNLAHELTEQGDYDAAEAHARRAIEIAPRFADAYINLAGLDTARSRHTAALAWLELLLSFAPGHCAALSAKALTLKQLDRLDEALTAARQAVAAQPESADAHDVLGQILQATDQFEPALAAYEKAASLPGGATEKATINRAVLFMERGETARAQVAFGEALDRFPRSAAAWFNRADLHRFVADDPAIGAMQALLGPGGTQSASDRIMLHFALGKAFLDIGDSAQAFHHLNAGNGAKRATLAYDGDETARWMAEIAEIFDARLLARLGGAGPASERPVFVVGMPRSGTTLIEQILGAHPAVHPAGELPAMLAVANRIDPFPGAVPATPRQRLAVLGELYLRRIGKIAPDRRFVVDKMPANFLHAGLIRLILPGARIVHCRRDPVDTCLSCYSKLFTSEQAYSYDMAELGRFHRGYQTLMAHWRHVLPESHFIEVDYEAVVSDLETEARRLIAFLGLPWDDACLDFHRTTRTIRTASVNQIRQPVYRSAAGRWRQHAAHLGPLLNALGL